jgi:hypothetical protein
MLSAHISSYFDFIYGGDIAQNHGSVFQEKKSIGNKPEFFIDLKMANIYEIEWNTRSASAQI